MESALDILRIGVGGAVVIAGLIFMLGGAIGVLRFPDFYTRLHALRVADTIGAVVVLVGLAIASPDAAVSLRLLALAALIAALGPAFAFLLAGAAHAGGVAPRVGRYTAPRPGDKSRGQSL